MTTAIIRPFPTPLPSPSQKSALRPSSIKLVCAWPINTKKDVNYANFIPP